MWKSNTRKCLFINKNSWKKVLFTLEQQRSMIFIEILYGFCHIDDKPKVRGNYEYKKI